MEQRVTPTVSKTASGEVPESVHTPKDEADETVEDAEESTLLSEQLEPAEQPGADHALQEDIEETTDHEITSEELEPQENPIVYPESIPTEDGMSVDQEPTESDLQEDPAMHTESTAIEDGMTLEDQEPTESDLQKEHGQSGLREIPVIHIESTHTEDDVTFVDQETEQESSHTEDDVTSVDQESVHEFESDTLLEQQSLTIIEDQSETSVVQKQESTTSQMSDGKEPIKKLSHVLDKQEQTWSVEEDGLFEDTSEEYESQDTRQVQNILDIQKSSSVDVISQATATVKIMVLPDGHVITMAYTIGNTTGTVKEYFASELKIPQAVIQIMFAGKIVQDTETLMDLGVRPHGTIQLEMLSTDQDNYPIKAIQLKHEYNMPDFITVTVQTADGATSRDVVVEIERLAFHKPYLGGYKHKLTGAEFHHAGTQTVPKKRPDKGTEVFSRDTQTVVTKNKYQQSRNTTSTQMTKIGVYVANLTDKLIQPRKYVTADEYHARRLKAVIIIQKYYRRFSAKRHVEELRSGKVMRTDWELKEEQRKKKENEERLLREHERRMNPKTKQDFEILYHLLEKWRLEEVERINNTLTGAARKAALYALLEQETELIASIERYKLDANVENAREAIQNFLEKSSQPKQWTTFDGRTMNMHTQYTIRAKELSDIYSSITMKHLTADERMDALLTLKHTVKEHDCKLTKEIVELIDREADLLMRGVHERNLEGLRKRIGTLFMQYIKTPMFNPEVARLLKVPQDPVVLSKDIYFCSSCKTYLPSIEFSLSANAHTIGKCRQCTRLNNIARRREDTTKYKSILKDLKHSEADYGDESRIAFLLQEVDIKHLVENIWAAQSILSSWDDVFDLTLARWNKLLEWSPWNCILLTKDEARAHLKLRNAEQAYGVTFIRNVKHKHVLAKNHFAQIPKMVPFLHENLSHNEAKRNDLLITKSTLALQNA